MNILFLSLSSSESLEYGTIYNDLLLQFYNHGHNIFIASPRQARTNKPTELLTTSNSNILKVRTGNITKTSKFEKGISTLRIQSQYLKAIKKYYSDTKFDLVIYATPPITFTEVVKYIKKRDNAKSYLLLKDIFPQNAVDLGMLNKKGFVYKYFRKQEKKLYEISDYIGTMSNANSKYILNHNPELDENKIEVCPNTIEPREIKVTEQQKVKIRSKYNIPLDKKVFIYGGNLGRPQGIDFLIECVKKNENNTNSFFVIVGSGTEYSKLKSFFTTNVIRHSKLIENLPKEEYELLTNSADVGMIFLDKRFTIPNFPSRLLSYMQAKIPVISATDPNTDIGDIIESGNFGYYCISDNVDEFNNLVNKLAIDSDLKKMGQRAWDYLRDNYTTDNSYKIIMNHF